MDARLKAFGKLQFPKDDILPKPPHERSKA